MQTYILMFSSALISIDIREPNMVLAATKYTLKIKDGTLSYSLKGSVDIMQEPEKILELRLRGRNA